MRAGSIAIFKLVSGEEMIGEVFDLNDKTIVVKNSAVVMLQRTEQGMGVALMPYMPYCEGNISFHREALVAEGEPSPNMVNEYNRLYGSGIQIAPASALVGL